MQIGDLLLYLAIAAAGLLALPALVLIVLAVEARRGTLLAEDTRMFGSTPEWVPARGREPTSSPVATGASARPHAAQAGTASEP